MAGRSTGVRKRPPTAADFKTLRRLQAAAGGRRELDRWIDAALAEGRPSRGRKHNQLDELMLLGLAHMCRMAEQKGISRHAMIEMFVASLRNPKFGYLPAHIGASERAVAARLYKKLKAIDFSDRAFVEYFEKFGLDPSRVTLTLPSDR